MTAPALAGGASMVGGTAAAYAAGQSAYWSGTLRDRNNQPIPLSAIALGTLRVVDELSGEVVNDRDPDDPLLDSMWKWAEGGALVPGAHGVQVHPTSGALTWTISVADLDIADPYQEGTERCATWTVIATDGNVLVSDHRMLIFRRPILCTVADVRNAAGGNWDEHFESMCPGMIFGVTDLFEQRADRKILKLPAKSPEHETFRLYPGSTPHLRRYPVDALLGAVFSDTPDATSAVPIGASFMSEDFGNSLRRYPVGELFIATFAGEATSVDSGLWLDARTGRLGYEGSFPGAYLHVTYAGGMALSTGGLPRSLRDAATEQVLFQLQNAHRVGLESYDSATSHGGTSRFVSRTTSGKLLPSVAAVFDSFGRL